MVIRYRFDSPPREDEIRKNMEQEGKINIGSYECKRYII